MSKGERFKLIKQLEQLSKENKSLNERVQKLEKQKSDEKSTTQKLLFATTLMNFIKLLYEVLSKFF